MKTLLAFVLVCVSSVAQAETICDLNCTAAPNQALWVQTDAAACSSNCALVMNGTRLSVPWQNDGITLQFQIAAGLPNVGTYTFTIEADGVGVTDPNSLQIVDLCTTLPLKFSVSRWPSQPTGNRSFTYSTNYPADVSVDTRTSPWHATAIDARGCSKTVTR